MPRPRFSFSTSYGVSRMETPWQHLVKQSMCLPHWKVEAVVQSEARRILDNPREGGFVVRHDALPYLDLDFDLELDLDLE